MYCAINPQKLSHVFFDCQYSPYIWQLCGLKLGLAGGPLDSLLEEADNLIKTFKKKDKVTILARTVLSLQFGTFEKRRK